MSQEQVPSLTFVFGSDESADEQEVMAWRKTYL